MNILIIGSGGREHAIGKALAQSQHKPTIYCIGEWINPGLDMISNHYTIDITNNNVVVDFVKTHHIDIAIIGSENQLQQGIVDELEVIGVKCIGPTQQQSLLECDKAFARGVIPDQYNPRYKVYDAPINDLCEWGDDYVIKAVGLRGGKGVKLSQDHFDDNKQAIDWCNECIKQDGKVLVEEKLFGTEFSLMAFSDGGSLVHMPLVRDFKRLNNGDVGPNTGGMGCISYPRGGAPYLNDADLECARQINQEIIRKNPFVGVLYGSFMKTEQGIKVIEYNCRFGDPEAINVLELLKTDFVDIVSAMCNGTLKDLSIEWSTDAMVTNYITTLGYTYNSNYIDMMIPFSECVVYAKITRQHDHFRLHGSRGFAICSRGRTLKIAYEKNRSILELLDDRKCHYRTDIGSN